MARGYLPLLFALTALWGSSFMFIKVAVEDLEPSVMVLGRVGIASIALLAFLVWRSGARKAVADIRATGRDGLVLGFLNAALPFWLIGWGETHVDSGVAAIANASLPMFVVLLAVRFRPSERVRGLRLFGLFVGLAGVGVLAGAQPEGGLAAVAGTLAVVGAALCYAGGALFGQHLGAVTSGAVLATVTTLAGTLFILPFALAELPDALPGWRALASVVALALLATSVSHLIYYRMLRIHGSSRTSLVTHLVPGMALLYGVLLLDEPLTPAKLGGLALILSGVALSSGVVKMARRRAAVSPTP